MASMRGEINGYFVEVDIKIFDSEMKKIFD